MERVRVNSEAAAERQETGMALALRKRAKADKNKDLWPRSGYVLLTWGA
ncbi:MAG: hypothetical protein ACOC7K_02655 [bacterium]